MVVGGGAAGIFGAIRAKTVAPDLNVVVIEKGKPLSKVFQFFVDCLGNFIDCMRNEGSFCFFFFEILNVVLHFARLRFLVVVVVM